MLSPGAWWGRKARHVSMQQDGWCVRVPRGPCMLACFLFLFGCCPVSLCLGWWIWSVDLLRVLGYFGRGRKVFINLTFQFICLFIIFILPSQLPHLTLSAGIIIKQNTHTQTIRLRHKHSITQSRPSRRKHVLRNPLLRKILLPRGNRPHPPAILSPPSPQQQEQQPTPPPPPPPPPFFFFSPPPPPSCLASNERDLSVSANNKNDSYCSKSEGEHDEL